MRRAVQKAILTGLRVTRLYRLLAGLASGRGAILTFHRVRPPGTANPFAPNAHLEVTPDFLDEALGWIRDAEIDIIGLDEARGRVAAPSSRRFVVLTFDDGYRDNLEYALPILKKYRAPFALYVCTGFIDRTAQPWWMVLEAAIARSDRIVWGDREFPTRTPRQKREAFDRLAAWRMSVTEDEQRAGFADFARRHGLDVEAMLAADFMNWEELVRLAAEPLATIGAHGVNHSALARLPEARARQEILDGADRIAARLGRRPRHFAYPYGYPGTVGEREYRLLADLGFATAVRTSPGVLTGADAATPTAWPRISMNGHFQSVGHLEVLLSGTPFLAGGLRNRLSARRRPPASVGASSPSRG